MPGKSRQKRVKYSSQSKKKRGRPNRPTLVTQQQGVVQARESVLLNDVSASSAEVPTPKIKPAAVRNPYIAAELRTIGIFAGIILVGLVVLALVLS